MKACVFPGQGSQFVGMGQKLLDESDLAQEYFEKAKNILGFDIGKIMTEGSAEDLKETKVTQPAVFLYAYIKFLNNVDINDIQAVAGHSLGEITALVANETISFEDGLKIVSVRAKAMQKACELEKGTMAAILGLDDQLVSDICSSIDDKVIAANFNCPGQVVISGSESGVDKAIEKCNENGARRAIKLPVGGAFHSELMSPAKTELAEVIQQVIFSQPICPIYQNVDAAKVDDPEIIKTNLLNQLTSPVRWTSTMNNMLQDGITQFVEPGAKVLSGFVKKIDRSLPVENYA